MPELVTKLKSVFGEFSSSHEQVVELEKDENVDHDKYFEEAQLNYIGALSKAKSVKH